MVVTNNTRWWGRVCSRLAKERERTRRNMRHALSLKDFPCACETQHGPSSHQGTAGEAVQGMAKMCVGEMHQGHRSTQGSASQKICFWEWMLPWPQGGPPQSHRPQAEPQLSCFVSCLWYILWLAKVYYSYISFFFANPPLVNKLWRMRVTWTHILHISLFSLEILT